METPAQLTTTNDPGETAILLQCAFCTLLPDAGFIESRGLKHGKTGITACRRYFYFFN